MTAHGDSCDREKRVLREQEQANLELRAKAAELTGADPDADPAELLRIVQEANKAACEAHGIDPASEEVKREQTAMRRTWQRQADLRRAGRDQEADQEFARIRERLHLGAAAFDVERRPRVNLQSIAPVARRGVPVMRTRGQGGRPAGRKTAAASSGGSSDDSSGEPAPANGPADLEVVHVEGERLQQTAIRLGVALCVWAPRGELIVTADEPAVLELILPLALALIEDRRGLRAVGMPSVFDPEVWVIVVEDGSSA